MKESYSENLASCTGLELYADDGNVVGVATTGVHAGQPLSSDITCLVCRRSVVNGRKAVIDYVRHYNEVRLRSAIGYVTPHTKLAGKENEVFADRDAKLEAAREQRRMRRAAARQHVA